MKPADAVRAKMAAMEKEKARQKARAKAVARARAQGARGVYMTDNAVEPEPEPAPQPAPQPTKEKSKGGRTSWLEDAPFGAKAAASAATAFAPRPKLRISTKKSPAALSSFDLQASMRQQQEQEEALSAVDLKTALRSKQDELAAQGMITVTNDEAPSPDAEAARAKAREQAKAKARAKAVAKARHRQEAAGAKALTDSKAGRKVRGLEDNELKRLQTMLKDMDGGEP